MSTELINHLTFIRKIGEGGFGTIFLVKGVDARYYALKRISFENAKGARRECHALTLYKTHIDKYGSPNIIPILDAKQDDSQLSYLMPLADGLTHLSPESPDWRPKTLGAVIQQKTEAESGWFSADEILALTTPIFRAVARLNEQGICHRDIKPDNILFINHIPHLGDLGLMERDHPSLSVVGTRNYTAPSWYQKSNGNPDMWGLATTFYTLATGHNPDCMTRSSQNYKFPVTGAERMPEAQKKIWAHFQRVLLRATEEEPNERFRNVEDFHRALENAINPSRAEDAPRVFARESERRATPIRAPNTLRHFIAAHATRRNVVGASIVVAALAWAIYSARRTGDGAPYLPASPHAAAPFSANGVFPQLRIAHAAYVHETLYRFFDIDASIFDIPEESDPEIACYPNYRSLPGVSPVAAAKEAAEAPDNYTAACGAMALGELYRKGEFVGKNPKASFKWFERAANLGFVAAQRRLAKYYFQGFGVSKDPKKVFEWCLAVAKRRNVQMHEPAYEMLGYLFANGLGVEQNETSALWCYLNAESIIPVLYSNIDFVRETIDGLERGPAKDAAALREMPDLRRTLTLDVHSNAEAAYYLGEYCERGIGCEPDAAAALTAYRAAVVIHEVRHASDGAPDRNEPNYISRAKEKIARLENPDAYPKAADAPISANENAPQKITSQQAARSRNAAQAPDTTPAKPIKTDWLGRTLVADGTPIETSPAATRPSPTPTAQITRVAMSRAERAQKRREEAAALASVQDATLSQTPIPAKPWRPVSNNPWASHD